MKFDKAFMSGLEKMFREEVNCSSPSIPVETVLEMLLLKVGSYGEYAKRSLEDVLIFNNALSAIFDKFDKAIDDGETDDFEGSHKISITIGDEAKISFPWCAATVNALTSFIEAVVEEDILA